MEIAKNKELILRHVKMSDAPMLLEVELDPENIKNMMGYTNNLKDIKKNIKKLQLEYKKKKPSEEFLIIEYKEQPAGYISLNGLHKEHFEHRGNIGYALLPTFRGKGITTKTVKMAVKYAFQKYKLKRLEGWCRTFNKASARVLEKAGFKLEGILRKNKCKDGKYLDDMVWAIVR